MSMLPPVDARVAFPDGPKVDWRVVRLRLDEGINQLYSATIELETEELEANSSELLGATCELSLARGELSPRMLFGIVARVDTLGQNDHHVFAAITVVPAFALARQRNNSRIWQAQSVLDIVEEVLGASLGEYGRGVELGHPQRGTKPRDYCTQYRETDFEFVCRLLEEEGISYYFVHDEARGHERLTLCDANDNYPGFANVDDSAMLPVIAHNPDEADLESIQSFRWTQQLRSTSVALSEYDFHNAGAVSASEAGGADARGRVRRLYDHGQRRTGTRELGTRAGDLRAAELLESSLALCRGNASLLAPGQRFTLGEVASEGTPEEWIVVAIEHDYGPGNEGVTSYRNTLRCTPVSSEIHPREQTPKPAVHGPQTATVVGNGEIDVDNLGRIEVQFHWPEKPGFSAGASCRVRCAQSWAGPGWGAQFIPRVGMEVVVEFLEGNPDRPLVTGCVYNGSNALPFDLPGNSTQSGWRTNSSPGGGGHNELRFEDAVGGEEIYLHGQRDWNTVIKHDKAQAIGHDETLSVANNRHKSVDVDETSTIGANQQISVGADQNQVIGANRMIGVGADQTVSVAANHSVSVGNDLTEVVGANASETVAFTKCVTVGGMLATVVGGVMNTAVGAASMEEVGGIKTVTVGASSGESVIGSKSVDAATISHSASKDLSQSSGANMTLSVGKALSLAAKGELSITGNAKGLIEIKDELTIKVGKAVINLKKNGDVTIEGAKISVKGKKAITLNAKKIDQN
jgi:type VI secretion system secreted protein VgrG